MLAAKAVIARAPNISELWDRSIAENMEPYRTAIKLANEKLETAIKKNKKIETSTKQINQKLEDKFRAYTT